jgi:hypothetical protein
VQAFYERLGGLILDERIDKWSDATVVDGACA